MNFRNYCIVVIGHIKAVSVIAEITKISEIPPNVLDGKGLLIATFTSNLRPSELKDIFIYRKLNFLLFDLDEKVSGYNITKDNIQEALFGFLKDSDDSLKRKNNEFYSSLGPEYNNVSKKREPKPRPIKEKKLTAEDIAKMSKKDKEKMFNDLIDKGVENLSEYDKNILNYIAK